MTWPTKDDFVDGDVLTAAQVNNIGTNLNVFNPTSATNGQVWVANGSGSGAYGAVGGGTVIASGTSTSITELSLTSIPGTYRSLQFNWRATPSTTATPWLRVNGATANYRYVYAYPNTNVYGSASAVNQIVLNGGASSGGAQGGTVIFPGYRTSGICTQCWFISNLGPNTPTIGTGIQYDNDVTSIQFRFDTGTITSITYTLLGFS